VGDGVLRGHGGREGVLATLPRRRAGLGLRGQRGLGRGERLACRGLRGADRLLLPAERGWRVVGGLGRLLGGVLLALLVGCERGLRVRQAAAAESAAAWSAAVSRVPSRCPARTRRPGRTDSDATVPPVPNDTSARLTTSTVPSAATVRVTSPTATVASR
jgi:hypothetical protein